MSAERCDRVRVERFLLGEGPAAEKDATRAHLDGCPACRGYMAGLENERRAYLISHPFREFASRMPGADRVGAGISPDREPARKRKYGTRWLPALAGLAVCLALAPVALRMQQGTAGPESGNAGSGAGGPANPVPVGGDIRYKGGPILEYYVKRDGGVRPGSASDAYGAGDEIQFAYAAGSHSYVTLASVDSRGLVSLYRGEGEAGSPSLAALPGERQALPFGVTLDDSPGSELFVMVFGPGPLAGGEVESWLQEAFTRASGNLDGLTALLAPPPGPAPSEVRTLVLRKSRG